jgi:two-component system cell cycle response regulator
VRRPEAGPEQVWPAGASPPPVSPALWVSALQEEINRSAGAPLSLLLTELEEAERVAAAQTGAEASAVFGEFAQAVRGVARRQDILVRETDSRAWVIARETGRGGARALASRIAEAVREGPSWGGAPMVASVGLAVLGEDGHTPAELIEAAEEARFAAEASGVAVIEAVPDAGGDEQ